eukprot:gene11515-11658_t
MGDDGGQPNPDRLFRLSCSQEAAQQQEASKSTQQLLESSRRLLRVKYDTQQAVTAIKVHGDELETTRRDKEEHLRQELRRKLLAEAGASAAANAQIAVRWGSVLALDVPQDLFLAIEEQRAACEAVMTSKDLLIADMRAALKSKDEEYVKLLKRQASDVDSVLAAMTKQLQDLSAAYTEELENVERALLQERADLLAANKKEVAALLNTRSTAEANFSEKYLAAVENYAVKLEELRHADAEEYQVLKIKLEGDIAVLEQHLETMRATYQLNAEKLDYNYRVLLERDAENTATINQQKRKLSRQHDVLSNLKQKYTSTDGKFSDENSKLTDEYKRITEQFKDLQAKFHHAVKADATKYSHLWQLQQEEASALVRQMLAADRVIHQQQLGWQWVAPDDSIFTSPHDLRPPSTAAGPHHTTAAAEAQGEGPEKVAAAASSAADVRADAEDLSQPMSGQADATSSNSGQCRPGSTSPTIMAATSGNAEVAQRLLDPQHYGALCLLVDEAGFLLEKKTAALIAQMPANEAKMVAADAIVRALGVTDGPAFDALMDALRNDQGLAGPGAAVFGMAGPSSLGLALATSVRPKGMSLTAGAAAAAGQLGGQVVVSRRAQEKEREFWEKLAAAVDDKTLRVWCRLEKQLGKYHGLLTQRSEGLAEIAALQQQNDELRVLLNQYLSSKINSELKIPPTAVL